MWDYDIAFDNDSRIGDTKYKYMSDFAFDSKAWIKQLLNDEAFYQTVKKPVFPVEGGRLTTADTDCNR